MLTTLFLAAPLGAQNEVDYESGANFAGRKVKLKQKDPEYLPTAASEAMLREAWNYIENNRYQQALNLYQTLQSKKNLSGEEQLALSAGLGVSLYHQKGCAAARPHLSEARKSKRFQEDAFYYIALCEMEAGRPASAKSFFEFLVKAAHPSYEEPSRFYLALIEEGAENYDDAKTAYADLVDFSKDASLVSNAKKRLKIIEYKMASDKRRKKPWNALVSLGGGYDTNAVLLPQSLDPSIQNLDSEQSAVGTLLFYGVYRYPWSKALDQGFSYSGVALHHFNHKVSLTNDIQSHDLGTELAWDPSTVNQFTAAFNYAHIFLGELKDFDSYMATLSTQFKWKHRFTSPEGKVRSSLDNSLKLSRMESIKGTASSSDPEGYSYLYKSRFSYQAVAKHSFGPQLSLEYRQANGTESSYWMYAPSGFWDIVLGKEAWGLKLAQELSFQHSFYYDSSRQRKDMNFSLTEALSKSISQNWESRLQVSSVLNVSNLKSNYQYDRFQVLLSLTGVY
jgi:hypothetical protein